MSPDDFRKLVAAGLNTDQIALVMEMIEAKDRAFAEAEEARKAKGRDRVQDYRDRLGITSSEWERLRIAVFQRDGRRCAYCGSTQEPLHVDHAVSLINGGTNDLSNLVVACMRCNCGKSGKSLEEWRP